MEGLKHTPGACGGGGRLLTEKNSMFLIKNNALVPPWKIPPPLEKSPRTPMIHRDKKNHVSRDQIFGPRVSRIEEIFAKFGPKFLDLFASIYGNIIA